MRYRSQDLNKGGPEEDAKEKVGNERPVPSGHNRENAKRARRLTTGLMATRARPEKEHRSQSAICRSAMGPAPELRKPKTGCSQFRAN